MKNLYKVVQFEVREETDVLEAYREAITYAAAHPDEAVYLLAYDDKVRVYGDSTVEEITEALS